MPFLAGRISAARTPKTRPSVVIVKRDDRKITLWRQEPCRSCDQFGGPKGPWLEIIGVVRDSKYAALREAPLAVAYLPVTQHHQPAMTLYVRTSVAPASLIGSLRRELQAIQPDLPVADIRTMTDTVGAALYTARMGAWLLSLSAACGDTRRHRHLRLLSFSISRRTREMGIRWRAVRKRTTYSAGRT